MINATDTSLCLKSFFSKGRFESESLDLGKKAGHNLVKRPGISLLIAGVHGITKLARMVGSLTLS